MHIQVGTEEDGTLASFTAVLAAPCVAFDPRALLVAAGGSAELAEGVTLYLASRDLARLQVEASASASGDALEVRVDGKGVKLVVGREVFFSVAAAAVASGPQ